MFERELQKEADRILRDAGNLREHGILPYPVTNEITIGDEAALDRLANKRNDRRSTRRESDNT